MESQEKFKDPKEDNLVDKTKIMTMLYFTFGFKIFKNICIILSLSYFLGIIFYILSDVASDKGKKEDDIFIHGFYVHYFTVDHTMLDRVIIFVYFSFTSLTTVGFGDFVPRSDIERAFTAVIIFVGIAVFSYIAGNFIEVLERFNMI